MDIDDIYSAVKLLKDVDVGGGINREKKSIKFKIKEQSYIIFLLDKEDEEEKVKILKAIKLKESEDVRLSFGRKIERKINLTSDNPCKVIYTSVTGKDHGLFVMQSIYSDKLNALKRTSTEELSANLVILILGLLLDVERCTQEIMKELIELKGNFINDSKEGNPDGKEE